jgi:hypothetical protein
MAYLAVDKDGTEIIYNIKPVRGTNKVKCNTEMWALSSIDAHYILLPKGSIKKLIGKDLTWDDEPVEIY